MRKKIIFGAILLCIHYSLAIATTTRETKENLRQLKLKQRIQFVYREHVLYSNYHLNINTVYKFYFNNKYGISTRSNTRPGIESYMFGGGFESPFITLGSIYEHGMYKYFYDMGKGDAWSSNQFERTRWGIRSRIVDNMPWGVEISIPRFGLHAKDNKYYVTSKNSIASFAYSTTRLVDSENNTMPQVQNATAKLAYDFNFFESELLYRHSWRDILVLPSSEEDSWLLIYPTALSLHQSMGFIKVPFDRLSLLGGFRLSVSDTTNTSYSYLTNLLYSTKFFSLSTQYFYTSPKTITSEWKYEKFLWSTSSEITFFYFRLSYIKVQAKVAEYHQIMLQKSFPQTLYRRYSLRLKQYIPLDTKYTKTQRSRTLFFMLHAGYSYTEYSERITQILNAELNFDNFDSIFGQKTYWYVDEAKREIEKIELIPSLSLTYSFAFLPITIKERTEISFEIIQELSKPEHFTQTLNIDFKRKGFLISFGFDIEFQFEPNSQSYNGRPYKFKENIKIQYNW